MLKRFKKAASKQETRGICSKIVREEPGRVCFVLQPVPHKHIFLPSVSQLGISPGLLIEKLEVACKYAKTH